MVGHGSGGDASGIVEGMRIRVGRLIVNRPGRPLRGAARLLSLAAALAVAAVPSPARGADGGSRARIVEAARRRVGRPFPGDCSGFVLATLREAGVSLRLPRARSRSESIHLATRPAASPRPGDFAFFDDTYDRNRDGLANDPYTHVALVESVEGGIVMLLHRGRRGIERIRMDLAHPSDAAANDPVRSLRRGEDPRTRVLAGELFSGYGTLP